MESDRFVQSHGSPTGSKPLVLIVDDSRLTRRALGKLLGEEFQLLEAENGESGWERLLDEPRVQLVFSDLAMPELDGFGLLARMRGASSSRIRKLPVIVVTGDEGQQEVRERALAAGANAVVGKPFQAAALRAQARASLCVMEAPPANLPAAPAAKPAPESLPIGMRTGTELRERMREELERVQGQPAQVSLLLVRVDAFPAIERVFGAKAARYVSHKVAELLCDHTRREDTLARTGEASFALWSPSQSATGALKVGQRLVQDVSTRRFVHENVQIPVSVSVGVTARLAIQGSAPEQLIALAQRRLSAALGAGGNVAVGGDERASPAPPARQPPAHEAVPSETVSGLRPASAENPLPAHAPASPGTEAQHRRPSWWRALVRLIARGWS